MFLLMGSIASIIVSVLQISFFSSTRKVGASIHTIIKNLFLVDLTSLAIQKYVLHYEHFLNTSSYKPIAFVKFFIIALFVALVFLGINALVNRYISFEEETPKKTKGTKALAFCFRNNLGWKIIRQCRSRPAHHKHDVACR